MILLKKALRFLYEQAKALFARKLLFSILSTLVVVGLLGWLVWRQKDALLQQSWDIHPDQIALSFLLYSIILFLTAACWIWMLRAFSGKVGFWKQFRAFCISALGKRLPGTVWYVAWRAQLYKEDGISLQVISLVSGIELLVSTLSAVAVSILFSMSVLLRYRASLIALGAMVIISLILIHPRVIGWISTKLKIDVMRLRRRDPDLVVDHLQFHPHPGRDSLVNSKILFQIPTVDLPYVIGVQALVAGLTTFLFFFPTNMGFAEVSLSLLLSSIMPSSIAVVAVIINRLIVTIFDIIWAIGSLLVEFRLKKGILTKKYY